MERMVLGGEDDGYQHHQTLLFECRSIQQWIKKELDKRALLVRANRRLDLWRWPRVLVGRVGWFSLTSSYHSIYIIFIVMVIICREI